MAASDQIIARLRGTLLSIFRIGTVQWKDNSGVVEAKNTGDTALAKVRGADAAGTTDLVALGQVKHSIQFSLAGKLQVADNIGMWWFNTTGRTLTLSDVRAWRETAGGASSSIADVQIDTGGTGAAFVTAYDVAANRPTITAAAGNSAFGTFNTFTTTKTVAAGGIVRVNIAQVETINPQNLVVQATFTG